MKRKDEALTRFVLTELIGDAIKANRSMGYGPEQKQIAEHLADAEALADLQLKPRKKNK